MEESSILARMQTKNLLITAYESLYAIPEIKASIPKEHIENTPSRIAATVVDWFEGCWENPVDSLNTMFTENKYDEIIYVNDISFVSMCAHHNQNFFGKMHFGYLPDGKIVGLSKIPRLVKTFSRRPQVQEKLTQDIVDFFMERVNPKGCGLVVEAWHLCMMVRGIEQKPAYTKTTALRGTFKERDSTKQEFLDGVKQCSRQIWP